MKKDEYEKSLDLIVDVLVKSRKEQGISHEKLAALSGLSRTAISYIESRKSTPSIVTCMKLCDVLGVKLSELLREVKH
ncbi:MAG: helix-turn-helix transcriptional regulator [Alphaproteobacteria bacterium]|nr:helix-turn-helix transcriptional regulator [Alphaproteobacteria bacterium]